MHDGGAPACVPIQFLILGYLYTDLLFGVGHMSVYEDSLSFHYSGQK